MYGTSFVERGEYKIQASDLPGTSGEVLQNYEALVYEHKEHQY